MSLITCESHTIIHDRIKWKPCNHKSLKTINYVELYLPEHYTQICKVSHGYTERVHTTKITSSGIHTCPKLHINKDVKWPIESKKFTLQQIITYIKILAYIGILFMNRTMFLLL